MSDYTRTAGENAGFLMDPASIQALNSVTNALLALNSAANFAIYCLVGKKFRRILRRRIFHCIPNSTNMPGGARSNNCSRYCCCCCCCCCCCGSRRDSVENAAYHTCTRLDDYSIAASRVPVIADTADEQRGLSIPMTVVADPVDVVELKSNDYNENDGEMMTSYDGIALASSNRQAKVSFCPSKQANCTESFSNQSVEHCIVVVIETEALSARTAVETNATVAGPDIDYESPSGVDVVVVGGIAVANDV